MSKLSNFIHSHDRMFGYVGTIFAVLMFGGLIEIAVSNLTQGTHIFIQPIFAFLTASVWSLYGYAKKDWFIFTANIGGVFLGIFTIITAFV